MVEVFTIGGGDYIVNTLNAVAAWTGGGGYRSAIRVVMVLGLIYVLLIMAFNQDWRALIRWFLQSTLIFLCVLVPTVTVKVTDRLNPTLRAPIVGNVPIGLGVVAGFTSQVGDWLTERAETLFNLPSSLRYNTNGMIYGSRLLEITRQVRIENPIFATNLENHMKLCVFYDVLQGFKSMDDIAKTSDLWGALGPGSVAKFQPYLTVSTGGGGPVVTGVSSANISCREAYANLTTAFAKDFDDNFLKKKPKQVFPERTQAAARTKFLADVSATYQQFTGVSQTAFMNIRQALAVNSFMQARDNFAGGSGSAQLDAFASTRADIQARNAYTTIAQSAMKWVPLLNIILTVIFYAMFPIVFLLFLLPQSGIGVMRAYFGGFFYLAAWGPLYVVINMFLMSRAQTGMLALTLDSDQKGAAMVNFAGIGALNDETATLAGTFIAFIPVLAGAITKGASAISSSTESLFAPARSAAEAAAVETTTGNLTYGQVNLNNQQVNTRNTDQWNTAPRQTHGNLVSTFVKPDGGNLSTTANGSQVYDSRGATSNLRVKPSFSESDLSGIARTATHSKELGERALNAASSEQAAASTAGVALSDVFTASTGSSSENGSGTRTAASIAAEKSRSVSDRLQSNYVLDKSFTEGVGKTLTYGGVLTSEQQATLNAAVGKGVSFGVGGSFKHATSSAANNDSNIRDSSSAANKYETGLDFVKRIAVSENFSEVRDNFRKEASSSGNSQAQSLASRAEGHLTNAQRFVRSADTYASEGQRLDKVFNEASNASFSSQTDLQQQFVRYVEQQQALDPLLASTIRATDWDLGLAVVTPEQSNIDQGLLRGFKQEYVARALGPTSDKFEPLDTSGIIAPDVRSGGDVERFGRGTIAGIEARRPAGSIRTDSTDPTIDRDVKENVARDGQYINANHDKLERVTGRAHVVGGKLKTHVQDLNADPLATVAGHRGTIIEEAGKLYNGLVGVFGNVVYGDDGYGSSKKKPSSQAVARFYGVGTKPGAQISNLDDRLKPVIGVVAQNARDLGLPSPVITSGNDSTQHRDGSAHYDDRGLDFRGNNLSATEGRVLASRVQRDLGRDYFVNFEVFPRHPERNHLHAQYGRASSRR